MATDNAKMNKAGTMRKVLSYMKRYIPLLVISLALSVVTVALTLYFPILTGRAIDLIVGKGKVDFSAMTAILTRAAIIVVIAAAAQWLTNICNNRMTYNIVRDIRRDAFLNIEKMPLSYIDSHSHGDMVSRIIADVDTFSEGLSDGLYTALYRNCNNSRHTYFHAHDRCEDIMHCSAHHTFVAFCGKLYH